MKKQGRKGVRKINQLTLEEAQQLEQKYGTDWICPLCSSSMCITQKLIRHQQATREKFPCVLKCVLCDREEIYWVKVDGKYLVRLRR